MEIESEATDLDLPPPPAYEEVVQDRYKVDDQTPSQHGVSDRLPPYTERDVGPPLENCDVSLPDNQSVTGSYATYAVNGDSSMENAQPDAGGQHFDTYVMQGAGVEFSTNEEPEKTKFLPVVAPENIEMEVVPPRGSHIPTRFNRAAVMETTQGGTKDGRTPDETTQFRPSISVHREVFEIEEQVSHREKKGCPTRCLQSLRDPGTYCTILIVTLVISIIVFIGVFPPSFVYLDYGFVALKLTRSTGYVNTKEIVYPGCHLLGPDIELKVFKSSAETVEFNDISSFLSDRLRVSFSCNFQYFLRTEEIGRLHDMFEMQYHPVLKQMALSTLKNTFTKFSLDDIRLNRSFVEKEFHLAVQKKLGGTCCPSCCRNGCQAFHPSCTNGNCNYHRSTCDPGYSADVRLFNFGAVSLPDIISEKFLKAALIEMQISTTLFEQKSKLEDIETNQTVQRILNEESEITHWSEDQAELIRRKAQAKADSQRSLAEMRGWQNMCSKLSLTQMDHKLSMFFIKTLDSMDNLYAAPGEWRNLSMYTGPT